MRALLTREEAKELVGVEGVKALRGIGKRCRRFSVEKVLRFASKEGKMLSSEVIRRQRLCQSLPFFDSLNQVTHIFATDVLTQFLEEKRVYARLHPNGVGIGALSEMLGYSTTTIYVYEQQFDVKEFPQRVSGKWLVEDIFNFVESQTTVEVKGAE